jgi:hypothetical protein
VLLGLSLIVTFTVDIYGEVNAIDFFGKVYAYTIFWMKEYILKNWKENIFEVQKILGIEEDASK